MCLTMLSASYVWTWTGQPPFFRTRQKWQSSLERGRPGVVRRSCASFVKVLRLQPVRVAATSHLLSEEAKRFTFDASFWSADLWTLNLQFGRNRTEHIFSIQGHDGFEVGGDGYCSAAPGSRPFVCQLGMAR